MSSVIYMPAFTKNVGGQLKARFRVDADHAPIYWKGRDGLKNYQIYLSLEESPRAAEIDSVKYFMDDPTFWDPLAVSEDGDNGFLEEISSYGDVEVEVTVQIKNKAYKQRAWLSNLLKDGYGQDASPEILEAIRNIKEN